MILVDANILLYAEDLHSPFHDKAVRWWDDKLSQGEEPVCLCWTVLSVFIRIGTNHRVFENPLTMEQATDRIQSWLNQPCTRIVRPTKDHWTLFQKLLVEGKALGNLVTDAHLAALAMEHGCAVASGDAGFSRFSKLKWINPLTS